MKFAAVGALVRPDDGARDDRGRDRRRRPGSRRSSTPARTASREALYAYTSQSNNNGSAFAGYGATTFSTTLGTVALYFGRFVPLLAALAIGGSLAGKKVVPASAGTFRTDGGDVRRHAPRRDRAHGRSDDPAGPHARPDRGRADALMRALLASVVGSRRLHRRARLRLPGAHDRLRRSSRSTASRPAASIVRNGRVVGSSLAAQSFTSPRYFHERPSATTPAYNAAAHDVLEPRPDEPGAREARAAERRGDPQARSARTTPA